MTETVSYEGSEDRTFPAIVYGVFLIAIATAFPVVLGLILAYLGRDRSGPQMRTHYTFLIRTCWLWLAWVAIGFVLVFWGAIFSLILIGVPFLMVGWAIWGLVHFWFALRVIAGVVYLAREQPYPRPRTWLI